MAILNAEVTKWSVKGGTLQATTTLLGLLSVCDLPHGLVARNGLRIGLLLSSSFHATTLPCRVPKKSRRARLRRQAHAHCRR